MADRRYQDPVPNIRKARAMRMVAFVREAIVDSVLEERKDGVTGDYVEKHKNETIRQHLAGHFPTYISVVKDEYASDVAAQLAKEITYYILHGDTPGKS